MVPRSSRCPGVGPLAHDLVSKLHWLRHLDGVRIVLERTQKVRLMVVTGDGLFGKPHPQPYQRPQNFWSQGPPMHGFEDSPSGVHSAIAAGAMTFVVPGDNPVPEDLEVTFIDSLEVIDHAWISQYWNA